MTTRTLNGLTFHVHSPSLWELADTSIHRDLDDGARVVFEYSGLPSRSLGGGWWLRYCIPDRQPLSRMFNSREQAIEFMPIRLSPTTSRDSIRCL